MFILLVFFFLNFAANYTLQSNLSMLHQQKQQKLNVQFNLSIFNVSAPEILSQPLWYRFIYYNLCCFSHRIFYYIAWTLADLVNNASGFGFNGYDEKGKAKWDLLTNVNIIQLEVNKLLFTVNPLNG